MDDTRFEKDWSFTSHANKTMIGRSLISTFVIALVGLPNFCHGLEASVISSRPGYRRDDAVSVNEEEDPSVPTQAPSESLPTASPSVPGTSTPTVTTPPTGAASSSVPHSSLPPSTQPSYAPAAATTTDAPTIAPTTAASPPPTTAAPTTVAPTTSPTAVPTQAPSGQRRMSVWRFIEKTIALFILLVLALLAFGAIMSNRYRIYFFLRGVWYTILSMECTGWIMRKLRLGDYQPVDTGLNTVIFEHEMDEGLLMRNNNDAE